MGFLAKMFLSVFGLFAVLNLYYFVLRAIQRQFVSLIGGPIGGVVGCIGFLLTPSLRSYAWLPLLLDLGTLFFLLALPQILRREMQTSRVNLLREYVGQACDEKKVELRLYKENIFVLRQSFHTQISDEQGTIPVALSTTGQWKQENQTLSLTIGTETALFLETEKRSLQQQLGFAGYEKKARYSLGQIELALIYEKQA